MRTSKLAHTLIQSTPSYLISAGSILTSSPHQSLVLLHKAFPWGHLTKFLNIFIISPPVLKVHVITISAIWSHKKTGEKFVRNHFGILEIILINSCRIGVWWCGLDSRWGPVVDSFAEPSDCIKCAEFLDKVSDYIFKYMSVYSKLQSGEYQYFQMWPQEFANIHTWRSSILRSRATTIRPSLRSRRVMAAPIPELAPVTSATLPDQRSIPNSDKEISIRSGTVN